MFLNTNQFLHKLQLSCASGTICFSILRQTCSQGFKLSRLASLKSNLTRRSWLQGFYLICSAIRALVFCAHVLRERGVSTGIWLLGFWYPTKLQRKKTKLVVFPLLASHLQRHREGLSNFRLNCYHCPSSMNSYLLFTDWLWHGCWQHNFPPPALCLQYIFAKENKIFAVFCTAKLKGQGLRTAVVLFCWEVRFLTYFFKRKIRK